MATLIIKKPDGSEQEQELAGSLTIGRAEGNDLLLTEGGVSRKHARFFVEDGAVMVEDTGSANGTWVNGEKIEGPTPVTAKCTVVIGDYEVVVKAGPKKAARQGKEGSTGRGQALKPGAPRSTRVMPAVKDRPQSAALAKRPGPGRAAGPQLRGLSGAVTGKTFTLKGTMAVGRVAGVDLQIDDDSVSRKHAELIVTGREVTLKDLGSANGTTVNGAPISDDTLLQPGDIIQFGVVELMFETGSASGSRAAISRTGRAAAEPAGRRGRPSPVLDDAGPLDTLSGASMSQVIPMDPKKKKLIIIGSVAGVLLLLLVAWVSDTGPQVDRGAVPLAQRKPKRPVAERTEEEIIEELLAECRTYSGSTTGSPDWGRARAACSKVLELDPIHKEANTMLKRISVLKVCEDHYDRGRELTTAGSLEEALAEFEQVGKECEAYLIRTLTASKEAIEEVKRTLARECKSYASNAKWEFALKRCEEWSRLWCQTAPEGSLYPPALMKLKLEGSLNKQTEWRPSEPLYLNFLKAREKLKPGEPLWVCPEIPAFRPPPPPPDPARAAKDALVKRYPEPGIGQALVFYFDGRFSEAPVPLQKIRENVGKAQWHEVARSLQRDINQAINLFENGSSEITNNRPDKAEGPYMKALGFDERIVLGERADKMSAEEKKRELEKNTSFIRRAIVETMSRSAYESGKALADRKDFRAACLMWKLGAKFSRGNIDLLKALTNVCTRRAGEALERAETCAQLKAAQDFAVEGDGFEARINDKLADPEWGCD